MSIWQRKWAKQTNEPPVVLNSEVTKQTSKINVQSQPPKQQVQPLQPQRKRTQSISKRSISKLPPSGSKKSFQSPLNVLDSILSVDSTFWEKNNVKKINNHDSFGFPEIPVDLDFAIRTIENFKKINSPNDTSNPTSISFILHQLNSDKNSLSDSDQLIFHDDNSTNISNNLNFDNQISLDNSKEIFENLNASILECTNVLDNVQQKLFTFHKSLSLLSTEISHLQARSDSINKKLNNRIIFDQKISPYLQSLILAPQLVKTICEGEINSTFITALDTLSNQKALIEEYNKKGLHIKLILNKNTSAETLTVNPNLESLQLFEMLIIKAVERIRDFFVARIRSLRMAGINAQSVQQSLLNRYKPLINFIYLHNPQLTDNLISAYLNTMRWYYLAHFRRYMYSLQKLPTIIVNHLALLGAHDDEKWNLSSLLSSSNNNKFPISASTMTSIISSNGTVQNNSLQDKSSHATDPSYHSRTVDPLIIGDRFKIINDSDKKIIPLSATEENTSAYWIEDTFRSFTLALMDNASFEYIFISQFFSFKSSNDNISLFKEIFKPTFEIGNIYTNHILVQNNINCLDAYGVLICIRICQQFTFEMQNRNIPVMENYLNNQMMTFWPRFQQIIDAHCESLRRAASKIQKGKNVSSSSSSKSSSYNIDPILAAGAPHPLTQRFATFIQGLLILSENETESEPLTNSIQRLRSDFEVFLTKLSGSGPTNLKGKAIREIFLYNNYSLVLTILTYTHGKLADAEQEHFKRLIEAYNQGKK